jgi:hypothetical protein
VALQAIRAELKAAEPEVVDAAVRALAGWETAAPLAELRMLAREAADETQRVLALRGLARLIRLPSERGEAETLALLEEAYGLAQDANDRRLVLAGLGDLAGAAALAKTLDIMGGEESLRDDAAVAAVAIARRLAADDIAAARGALGAVRAASVGEAATRAADEASALFERFAGYVSRWQASGPYQEDGLEAGDLFEKAFAPETAGAAEWRSVAEVGSDNPWLFDLGRLMPGSQRCAYFRARIESDREQTARLEIGSDDGVKAWLNGELVHSNLTYRVLQPGDDLVPIALRAGEYTLLLKIVQGGGPWGFCCGVRDAEGRPIEGLRFSAE